TKFRDAELWDAEFRDAELWDAEFGHDDFRDDYLGFTEFERYRHDVGHRYAGNGRHDCCGWL
ncbi:MAG: hypothetical protein ABR971_00895, partial [Acidobacteriaceae bacterium]